MATRKRKSGTGTVRQRKDGRWEGRIVINYDEQGRPKTKNVLAKTKTECIEKLEMLKKELGAIPTTRCRADMPFGEWMDFWFQTYCKNTLRESTQTTYANNIYKHIIPQIGHIPLNQLTAGTLEKFYAHLKADGRLTRREQYGPGLSNSVVRGIHSHCKAALEKAVEEKLMTKNPADGCKAPARKSAEIEILTPEEMQKLLYQAEIEGFYEMFLLDLSTGLRRGELLGLQWNDIDFQKRTLKITRQIKFIKGRLCITPPKNQASVRTIILPATILDMLAKYRKTVSSIWLFPSPTKSEDVPRDPTACRKRLSQILERAGCKHIPFHALRHTFASQAFHYGMDVKMLAGTIGHQSAETTLNTYAHSSVEMKRSAAKKIDCTLGAALGTVEGTNNAPCVGEEGTTGQLPAEENSPAKAKFEPYKGKYRRAGTGSVHQVSKNAWEGRYSPIVDGKRIARNVYGSSEEECEAKLAELIREMKDEYGIK